MWRNSHASRRAEGRSPDAPRTITSRSRERAGGFTLLEVLISITVFLVALLAFVRVILASMAASSTTHEATIAREAARQILETVQAAPFQDAFRLYNGSQQDDLGLPAPVPGKDFDVQGLEARLDDPDGLPGEILFPTPNGSPEVLREDLPERSFGLPRDLNADGAIDGQDHAGDYGLLPVVVRVEWRSSSGSGRVELRTLLGGL